MPATRPNIELPMGQWVDIYTTLNAQSGFPTVTVGDALDIQNIGSSEVQATEKATIPVDGDGYRRLYQNILNYTVSEGSPSVWVRSIAFDGLINVEVG